jgi:TolB-like protein/DNA-binding winged helix-turn-helix (wHTH) protein/Flp pilus assembly protein TadD
MGDRTTILPRGEPSTPDRLRFARFVLDVKRGSLLLDGREIALRPKTFAVLRFLVENPGRLVAKDELFAAVWPGIAVTDDTLVQSIGELRRALGEDGARLIKTMPRRGYRFDSPVSADPVPPGATPPAAPSGDAGAPESGGLRTANRLTRALSAGPRRWLAALALTGLAAAAGLWVGVGPERLGGSLRSGTGAAVRASPAIAVLPLRNESGDAARAYFADGLTQDVIDALGRFSGLTVMSWNAVLPYRSTSLGPGEIARRLAVRYQVEGGVQRTADRVRVTAQLVDTDGRVLWSARFDAALADVFSLRDRLTGEIAQALAVRVTQIERQRSLAKPTTNLEAYDYVLRARPAVQHPTRENIVEARTALRRAIALDPGYAAAYAALAETFFTSVSMGWAESPSEFVRRAEEMADKALSLDDNDVRARVVLGRIDIFHRRYRQARAEMDRAIAVNPNDAHALAGRGNALMWLGQTDAAIDALEQAQRIDPEQNPMDRFALSLAYYLKGRYGAAIDAAELNLRETAGANFSRVVLAAAYAQADRGAEAARVAAEIHRLDPLFDPEDFGTKFLNPTDLENLRAGLRKAGLLPEAAGPAPR